MNHKEHCAKNKPFGHSDPNYVPECTCSSEPKKCCVKCRSGFTQSPLPDLCVNCKCHQSKPGLNPCCDRHDKLEISSDGRCGMSGMGVKREETFCCGNCPERNVKSKLQKPKPVSPPPKEEKELTPPDNWELEFEKSLHPLAYKDRGNYCVGLNGDSVCNEEVDKIKSFIAAKKKEWESALLEKIKEEISKEFSEDDVDAIKDMLQRAGVINEEQCERIEGYEAGRKNMAKRIQSILNNLK